MVQERGGVGILARFASGITHPLCPSTKGQGEERGRVKRHHRGRGWPARVLLLVGFAKREGRKKKERGRARWFGRISFEY
jgi:hypothetical protein